jgi:hypothetical protein
MSTLGINGLSNLTLGQAQYNDAFSRYDLIETSMHLNVKRLDLHIIADSDVSSSADRLVENGALQLTIANLSIDNYPYHIHGSSKKHWIKYNESQSLNRHEWAVKLQEEWTEQLNIAKASVPHNEMCMLKSSKKAKFLINYFFSFKIRKSSSDKSYSFIRIL